MDIWVIYWHKAFGIKLHTKPGDCIGRFEIAAESEVAAMHYILHHDKYAKVIGEITNANEWHLIAVEYQGSDTPDADIYTHTWVIDKREVYRQPTEQKSRPEPPLPTPSAYPPGFITL